MSCLEKTVVGSHTADRGSPRVLVVEDHPGIAFGVQALLNSRGYQVQLASCVDAALEALESGAYGLVVADFDLGDQDGLSLVRELRARHPTVPVLAVTAVDRAEAAEAAAGLSVAECLEKPVDPERLIEAVARHLET